MQGRQSTVEHAGGKLRLYEVAKEIGLPNKDLIDKARGLGIDVKNHMSVLDTDDIARVKRALDKDKQESREVHRLSSTVIRRRSKAADALPDVAPEIVAAPPVVRKRENGTPPADTVVAKPPVERPTVSPQIADDVVGRSMVESDRQQAEPTATDHHLSARTQTSEATSADRGSDVTTSSPSDVTSTSKPAQPKYTHRYAPGYEPGGPLAAKLQERRISGGHAASGDNQSGGQTASGEPSLVSAAELARMMANSRPAGLKPKVVITDLDDRRNAIRREAQNYAARPGVVGPKGQPAHVNNRSRKKKVVVNNKKTKKTEITTPAEHKRVIRLDGSVTVGDIARQMGTKATEVLKKLWAMGMTNVTINQSIDLDTASLLANEFGYEVSDVAFREEQVLSEVADRQEDMQSRAPVVTVMGHVDHGKTSLLDAIRNTTVASGEAGGITQHIGAYRVTTPGGVIVFLDTPGHEAFTHMRARGAQCTDIVVLVVAADDGVMPQTAEAIDHAKSAQVPIVVAINKIDRPDANPDRVRTALAERGLVPEAWGGDTMMFEVSARAKQGITELLDGLLVQSEVLELQANPDKLAKGTILEARLDKARGAMCSVLIEEGTLRVGDTVVAGEHMGKVRAMLDERGQQVREAGPSTPVELLGLGGVPQSGDVLNAVADDKAARTLAEYRQNETRRKEMSGATASKTYEEILGKMQAGLTHELKLLVKADVHGTSEAIRDALKKLATEKVAVNVISAGVGGISETDVNLAKAAGAVILGFNVRPAGKATQLAERERVDIRIYSVIYELLDDCKLLMQGLLPKQRLEKPLGKVEVRQVFTIPKLGSIAGSFVLDGKINRNALLRLVRENVKIHEGRVGSLKRFKDDVREVVQGYECGVSIDGYNDIRVGDVIEAYEIEEVAATL